ncbi:hypothetical protein HK405_015053, partial [Cladochytrium tenue]
LNKYNIYSLKDKEFDLQPHEQTLYRLHLDHIIDFCDLVHEVVDRSGPVPRPPKPSAKNVQAQASGKERATYDQQPVEPIPESDLLPDRVYKSGLDFVAKEDMDINVRKGDRVKMVTTMDGGLVLGTNLETNATGTFSVKCMTLGKLMDDAELSPPGGPEGEFSDVLQSNVPEDAMFDTSSSEENLHRSVSQRLNGDNQSGFAAAPQNDVPQPPAVATSSWTPFQVPNTLHRHIGRHIAIRTFQSGSVLEASLEVGDEVEVMLWEDEEMAVGIHVRSQTESLFRGSLLKFVGNTAVIPNRSTSITNIPPAINTTPYYGSLPGVVAEPVAEGISPPYTFQGLPGPSGNVRDGIYTQAISATLADEIQYKEHLASNLDQQPNIPMVQPPPRGSSTRMFPSMETPPQAFIPMPAVAQQAPPTEEQRKRFVGAKYVIAELHATEESYKVLLQVFLERVIAPMKDEKVLSGVDIDRAFKHIKPIFNLSVKVESFLRVAKLNDNGDAAFIAELFLTH